MQSPVWATFQVTDIFTGANMSRDGVIDCLGYLSMPLSLVQRPPNASFSSYIAYSCGEVLTHDSEAGYTCGHGTY